MIWVAWRQQRLQFLVSALLIAAVGAVMVFYRFDAVSFMEDRGIAGCLRIGSDPCTSSAMAALSSEYKTYVSFLPMVLLCLPVLLGMFAGAPLFAREFEQGTHVFGLTQSVGRRRWWATKLLVGGGPVAVLMLFLGVIGVWALKPLNHVTRGPLLTPGFETQGLVLGAYTVLAFAIGVAAGMLFRNTLAAMAITLGLYLVVLLALGGGLRPHYFSPERTTGTVAQSTGESERGGKSWIPDDAWRVGSAYYDDEGRKVSFNPSGCDGTESIQSCLTKQGVRQQAAEYYPATRFWAFQTAESTAFLTVAAALLALSAWSLRRRVL
ncbi:ABC transporter permease [Streptomyces bambusae]|uniref:ABC transporter permease subunit n=1 Tax=Streptomyces bambusae TaxID=1550616 RepID=A0ABS6Z0L6_9ACTN|nr:ABC transporter permease subunit [Streptomyces bambusae]MBW5481274.1 ABC transporter permease subunit [Streptomyces bambusae]